ncbi:mannose-6-phosphate isomerase [Planctomycetaceae bacterium SCGC AG-212-F19]|nr:mannose-6-phosphate isomerase [Planctomycetaceae bacterium SCGC AG-212-F19]
MTVPLYPLRFEPILQPRIWGGRQLASWYGYATDEPIGEAWVLSDREDHPSRIAEGPLKGRTLPQLMAEVAPALLGPKAEHHRRFPLLLKFLDARDTLSVQVHPTDGHTQLLPHGERGKTEAWIVLQAEPESRIFAGLHPGVTAEVMCRALAERRLRDLLASFVPKPGDGIMLDAGTVHALGGGVLLFEVQQNSDVTFRLYDWDRVDGQGKPRALHIEDALACTDFTRGPVGPVVPVVEATAPVRREQMFDCPFFRLWRLHGQEPFPVGAAGDCRVLVGIAGRAQLEHATGRTSLAAGTVVLWPATLGVGMCRPEGSTPATVLEIALPV